MLVRFVALSQKRTKYKQELGLNSARPRAPMPSCNTASRSYNRGLSLGSSRLPICCKAKGERGLRQQTCWALQKGRHGANG